MITVESLVREVRARGGKVTPQRLQVYRTLENNRDHPTAEMVFQKVREVMPTISLTTVYTALNELVTMGHVKAFTVDGVTHFDPDSTSHGETVCLRCGAIQDVPQDIHPIEQSAPAFQVTGFLLTVFGYCAACRDANATGEEE